MNYRHGFHAGNHADVLKHVVLLAICEALTAKPAPCFALDTHGGRGRYKLDAEAALRTGEAASGVGKLGTARSPAIARYTAALAACRAAHGNNAYPGSPWLLKHALRPQDRIVACELHPDEAAWLKTNFLDDPEVSVQERDGYAAMKALLPPRGGDGARIARGLVLIDPPYEAPDELARAATALGAALKRFGHGMYLWWRPLKNPSALAAADGEARAQGAKATLRADLWVAAPTTEGRLVGSSVYLINPPFGLREALEQALPFLADALTKGQSGWRLR